MIMSQNNMFFILGCQRSGTTLVRLILESHSKISCIDEPETYQRLLEFKKNNSTEPNSLLGFKAPVITEQLNDAFFSDTSLDFIILNKFKNFPRIFLIRDVRDNIVSMRRLKQENSTWYNLWPEKSFQYWKSTIPNFTSKFEDDISKISNSNDKLLSMASFYWKYKTMSYFDYEKNGTKLCKIRYEDLVDNPKETISKLTKFLNVELEDNMLHHQQLKHQYVDKSGLTIGQTNPKLPISNKSVGSYKNIFSKPELNEIMNISGDLMAKLGYELN